MAQMQVSEELLEKLRILKSLKGQTYEELINSRFSGEFEELKNVLKSKMESIREVDGRESD